jgi:hypothetical protein
MGKILTNNLKLITADDNVKKSVLGFTYNFTYDIKQYIDIYRMIRPLTNFRYRTIRIVSI